PAQGYGWSAGAIAQLDTGAGSDLNRDFDYTADGTFIVNVPDGSYNVSLTLGDPRPGVVHDQMGVFLQGVQFDSVTTAAGQVVPRTYTVIVGNGQLALRLKDLGGTDPFAVIEGLTVTPVPSPTLFDFGTPGSPVSAGYTAVSATTIYSPAQGYGWSAGAIA